MTLLDSKNITAKELKEKLSLIPDEANIGFNIAVDWKKEGIQNSYSPQLDIEDMGENFFLISCLLDGSAIEKDKNYIIKKA